MISPHNSHPTKGVGPSNPNGYRSGLLTNVSSAVDDATVDGHTYGYDALGRPVHRNSDSFGYNERGEVVFSRGDAVVAEHSYDDIGKLKELSSAITNLYIANPLNQYTSIQSSSALYASPREINPQYDFDGNLLESSQCASRTNIYLANNLNQYLSVQTISASSAFSAGDITLSYDPDGNQVIKEYFWGMDKSGTEQGAGGVGGLLAVSVNGVFSIPCYDHNGNIVAYVSETGGIEFLYVYDAYGNTIEKSGEKADVHSFGFSTKYHDRETGMVGYKRRFYRPDLGRWLNRDPIEEEGGENVYCFVENSPSWLVDLGGLHTFQFTDKGWSYGDTLSGALTDNVSVLGATRTSRTSSSKCSCTSAKWSPDYTFKVEVYSLIQFADDGTWDDDNYGSGVRDPRVREKWDSFWFFEARRRRNLVIEHEERHRKHAQKNYNAIVRELNVSEQYSSKGVCESKASEKIAAAVRLFDLMERADEEKVERGDL